MLAKLVHCCRVLRGPWDSAACKADVETAIEQMQTVLTPGHPYLAGDIPTMAEEMGLGDDYTPEEVLSRFADIAGIRRMPENACALGTACTVLCQVIV